MRQKVDDPNPQVTLDAAQLDIDIGQWVYDQQKPAGRGTDTLPSAGALYLPLKAPMRTRGVMALITGRPDELAAPEQQRMIDTFASQIALALERVHYVEIAQDALVNMESERMRNALLSAISHDLRTPLTSIVGFASVLDERQGSQEASDPASRELVHAIHEEALRMSGLVTNLLDMARLQSGSIRLNREWSMLEEVVGAALAACRRTLGTRAVQVRIPPDLPLIQLDAVLMERLLANLFENAAKYTPQGTPLQIHATLEQDNGERFARVCIDDNGAGLPTGIQQNLFDKFTRGEKESAKPGIGLGLAICRAIVEAHGGRIGAENREGEGGAIVGARFWFTLPIGDAPPMHELSDDVAGDTNE